MTYLINHTPYLTLAVQNLSILEYYPLAFPQRMMTYRLRVRLDSAQFLDNRSRKDHRFPRAYSHEQSRKEEENSRGNFMSNIILLKLNSHLNHLFQKASNQYLMLWQILMDDSLAIDRFYEQLEVCYACFEGVNDFWKKNKVLDVFHHVAKRNYGLFLAQVLQREREGTILLEDYYNKMKLAIKKISQNYNNGEELGSVSDPIMIIKVDDVSD